MCGRKLLLLGALVGLLAFTLPARADVKPNALISDGMVLQQKTKARVWGTADPGEKVTVDFRSQQVTATADDKGKWSAAVETKEAGGPFPLKLKGKNEIELKNVFVGEVWVCSGQSNMQWAISASDQADKDSASKAPANAKLRMFSVGRIPSDTPATDVKGQWVEADPKSVLGMSAVGYFFGRDLQGKLNVPIGLINSSVGGTRAEAWTSREVLAKHPLYKDEVENFTKTMKKYQDDLEEFNKKKEGKPPTSPLNQNSVSALYNGMIHPLLPYSIKGAIWYQGESNAGKAYDYRVLFPAMIENWRKDFGQGDFPFLFVQLAPFNKVVAEPAESTWAVLRESQLLTEKKVAHAGMAVITDLGHEMDIHPTPKQPVGERLALLARARVYGEKVEYSGPAYSSMKTDGPKVVLTFTHADGLNAKELVQTDEKKGGFAYRVKPDSREATILGFTVAGDDKKFHPAKAKIVGNTVEVTCDEVAKPVAVRFGWAQHPLCNLYNKAGLPASPFRTDDWPVTTQAKK